MSPRAQRPPEQPVLHAPRPPLPEYREPDTDPKPEPEPRGVAVIDFFV